MEGTEGVCWLGQPQAGGSEEKRRRGKSNFSDLINGLFVYECGKREREVRLWSHGAS